MKKGKPSWKPAAMLDTVKMKPGFRPRWCSKDSLNLERKKAEGWEIAGEKHGIEHTHPEKMGDGHSLTSAREYRDMVLMALPEEMAQARENYFAEKTRKQTVGLKDRLRKDMAEAAPSGASPAVPDGTIVID